MSGHNVEARLHTINATLSDGKNNAYFTIHIARTL